MTNARQELDVAISSQGADLTHDVHDRLRRMPDHRC